MSLASFCNKIVREFSTTNVVRFCYALVATEGALFAIGGHNQYGDLSSMERLDDLNGEWKEVQPMKTPRYHFAAAACQGFVYAIGG